MKQAPWPKACVEAKGGHFEYLQWQQKFDVPLLSFEWRYFTVFAWMFLNALDGNAAMLIVKDN